MIVKAYTLRLESDMDQRCSSTAHMKVITSPVREQTGTKKRFNYSIASALHQDVSSGIVRHQNPVDISVSQVIATGNVLCTVLHWFQENSCQSRFRATGMCWNTRAVWLESLHWLDGRFDSYSRPNYRKSLKRIRFTAKDSSGSSTRFSSVWTSSVSRRSRKFRSLRSDWAS
jgi:hypothetical protein